MAHVWAIPFFVGVRGVTESDSDGVGQERNEPLGLVNGQGESDPPVKGQVDLPSVKGSRTKERDLTAFNHNVVMLERSNEGNGRFMEVGGIGRLHAARLYRDARTPSSWAVSCVSVSR
jgi:hypothetical protein